MKKICSKRVYEKDGEEKAFWAPIGEIIEGKNGKEYVKLYICPNEMYYVFLEDKKDE